MRKSLVSLCLSALLLLTVSCGQAEPVDNNGTIPADAQPVIESVTIREA